MTTEFRNKISSIAKEIVSLSTQLDSEITTWNDMLAGSENSTNEIIRSGYINTSESKSPIQLVIDIQALPADRTARLRIWAIETTTDSDNNERFNNIQLTYGLDYDVALQHTEKGTTPSRDDLLTLAYNSSNPVESLVISDLTGRDATTEQLLGTRYSFEANELASLSEERGAEIIAVMKSVIERLKLSAARI